MIDKILFIIIMLYAIPFALLICFQEYAASLICIVGVYTCIGYYQRDVKIVKIIDKFI